MVGLSRPLAQTPSSDKRLLIAFGHTRLQRRERRLDDAPRAKALAEPAASGRHIRIAPGWRGERRFRVAPNRQAATAPAPRPA